MLLGIRDTTQKATRMSLGIRDTTQKATRMSLDKGCQNAQEKARKPPHFPPLTHLANFETKLQHG